MRQISQFLRSRLPVFAALAVLALLLAAGRHHLGSLHTAWIALRIPALEHSFADTRTITHSIDCLRSGSNPYVDRSFDPWHRLYNYPPIWLDLRFLGISSASTNWLGSFFGLTALCACAALFRASTWVTRVLVFFAMLCYPLLFAIERGNNDLLIFALLVFAALLIGNRSTRAATFLRGSLIVLLTVLKLFPLAAVIALLRNRRAILTAALTAVLALAALLLTCGHDLSLVLANTPEAIAESFGSMPLLMVVGGRIGSRFSPHLGQWITLHAAVATQAALVVAVIAFVLGGLGCRQLRHLLPELDLNTSRGFLAVSGLAIFALAFAHGASYDYRLIFLFTPLASLLDDLNRKASPRSLAAAILLLACLWSPYLHGRALGALLDGIVFILACAWLGATTMRHLCFDLRPRATPAPSAPGGSRL